MKFFAIGSFTHLRSSFFNAIIVDIDFKRDDFYREIILFIFIMSSIINILKRILRVYYYHNILEK